jgi:hypothetical protein
MSVSMSTKSRQTIFGGAIIGAKIRADGARKRAENIALPKRALVGPEISWCQGGPVFPIQTTTGKFVSLVVHYQQPYQAPPAGIYRCTRI